MSAGAPRGHALLSIDTLRELLQDPQTVKAERVLHFRVMLNGRMVREWRQMAGMRYMTVAVEFTWLLQELAAVPREQWQDLRVEVTPET